MFSQVSKASPVTRNQVDCTLAGSAAITRVALREVATEAAVGAMFAITVSFPRDPISPST